MGSNGIGQKTMNQYYLLFGLWRLNEVDIQRVVGDYTSYDVEVEDALGTWGFFESLLLLPLTVTVRTLTVKY